MTYALRSVLPYLHLLLPEVTQQLRGTTVPCATRRARHIGQLLESDLYRTSQVHTSYGTALSKRSAERNVHVRILYVIYISNIIGLC